VISVVILTFNEASNLPRCLDSIRWCDDVLVLDSGSTDDTAAIARAAGARVMTRSFDSFAGQRNYAMEHGLLRNSWVLHLDADEAVTPEFREELRAISETQQASFPIYRVPSKLIFQGRWLRYSGMYPAYQVRFGRREQLRFIDHGHGQRESLPVEQVGTICSPLDHYNFSKGVNDWFARHLRYARGEASQVLAERRDALRLGDALSFDATTRRRALKRLANRLPFRPALRFFYVYIVRRGFLDGRAGFRYARMLGIYQYFIDLNMEDHCRHVMDAGDQATHRT
jgi:glycosyltransferase involved in cell wall biosynthesis